MLRIVLDTNALIMALPRKSPYRLIFDAFLKGDILLLIDNSILNEYVEVIERQSDAVVANNIGDLLANSPYAIRIAVTTKWRLIETDPDDNKFVDCAIAGQADYIVTNDRHFNVLREIGFPPVSVISIEDFVVLISQP
ncbi:MAG: putative toxin-antitoxin system toxin component, PIN family [Chitinophagales bacterium]|nr:putative toxin-antitoxin system toxin component, PIN family [Chitinophagales bacterium]